MAETERRCAALARATHLLIDAEGGITVETLRPIVASRPRIGAYRGRRAPLKFSGSLKS
jgi:hypothetical protein